MEILFALWCRLFLHVDILLASSTAAGYEEDQQLEERVAAGPAVVTVKFAVVALVDVYLMTRLTAHLDELSPNAFLNHSSYQTSVDIPLPYMEFGHSNEHCNETS